MENNYYFPQIESTWKKPKNETFHTDQAAPFLSGWRQRLPKAQSVAGSFRLFLDIAFQKC
jgi:hypothetical protein